MLDYIKLGIDQKCAETFSNLLIRLLSRTDFVKVKSRNNNFDTFYHKIFGGKMSFDFRKVVKNGQILGYREIYINISPHYHFNQYRHNGNDLTPENCILSLREIFSILELTENVLQNLKVINLEFGVNIIPKSNVKHLIDGLLFHKKTKFVLADPKRKPFFKITEIKNSRFKEIKAYAKGLHCHNVLNALEINVNTFRFEVRAKQSKKIRDYEINNASDLLNTSIYVKLGQELLNDWDFVFVVNKISKIKNPIHQTDIKFIAEAENIDFWDKLKSSTNRNKFNRYKERYINFFKGRDNLHLQIKSLMIDKVFMLLSGANSTQGILINAENLNQ